MSNLTDVQILSHLDHTLLKPTATWAQIEQLCKEALQYQTASVCIPPSYVKPATTAFPELNVCTVIGFPLGYTPTAVKVKEIEVTKADGANEFDMVINISDVKNGDYASVLADITALKQATGDKILKVIIETCYLTDDEKIKLCEVVTQSGADYIKTSTGFGTAGATFADIELFAAHIGPNVKMKAAGGVKTKDDLIKFIELGCARIGTSSGVKLVLGEASSGGY
jgi:deoxyribose-phosphate aldolase